jgi:MFS family permease
MPTKSATLPAILVAQFVIPMAIAGTAIALPSISDDLGTAAGPLQWVVNGFNVPFAIGAVLWGTAADRVGYRTTFRAGIVLALAGGLLSAVSTSLLMLDLSRGLAGLGSAGVLTGATSLLSSLYSGAERKRVFGLFGTVTGLGMAVGPTVSGLLTSGLGWRTIFLAHSAVLLVAAGMQRSIPRVRPEARTDRKLIDLRVLRNRRFVAISLVPVAGAIAAVTLQVYLPNGLSAILSVNPTQAGLVMLSMTVPVLFAPVGVARLLQRTSLTPMAVLIASLFALMIGALGLLFLHAGGSVFDVPLPLAFLGLGWGMSIGLVDGEALAAVPGHLAGTAAGLLNLFRVGSEAITVGLYSAVLTVLIGHHLSDPAAADSVAAGHPGHPGAYASALHTMLLAIAVLVALVTVAVWLLRGSADRTAGVSTAPEPAHPVEYSPRSG